MTDTIKISLERELLIRLTDPDHGGIDDYWRDNAGAELMREVGALLAQPPEQPGDWEREAWIACAERLPVIAGTYLTYSPHGYWPIQVHEWLQIEGAWEHEWLKKKRSEFKPKTWITYWRPLPEAPGAALSSASKDGWK